MTPTETLSGTGATRSLADVLDYWEAKRRGRFAPSRADIEPLDLLRVLQRIMIADVLSDPLDFRYRLSGTAIADVHETEITGLAPRDLKPAEYGRLIDQHYRQCVAQRRPLLHLILLSTSQPGVCQASFAAVRRCQDRQHADGHRSRQPQSAMVRCCSACSSPASSAAPRIARRCAVRSC